jgi:large subunit ribosomal protein L1
VPMTAMEEKVMKHGKKYNEAVKLIDRSKVYEIEEAAKLVKQTATAKFDETVELNIRTGCDGKHADQAIRGAVVLPNGTGKTVQRPRFCQGLTKVDEADRQPVLIIVGGEELIPEDPERRLDGFRRRRCNP